MGHTAFQPDRLEIETDYVVIGSGAGGASIAVGLVRGGASVTVVEAGAWRDPEDYPYSTYGGFRDLMPDWGAQLTRGRALWPIVQGRAVGGSTVINSAIVVRTPGDVFEEWTRDHGIGADLADRVWRHQDAIEEELGVGATPREQAAWGNSNRLAEKGAEKLGFDGHPTQRNAAGCQGSGQCLQGCRTGAKKSANLNFMPQVLQGGGHVVSCAPVDRIVFEGSRAVGVTGRFVHPQNRRKGGTFTVRARKAVVVAASATGSPILLQASGVRHRALGHYFRAHPGSGVLGVYPDVVDMNRGATQGWASVAFREGKGLKLEVLSLLPGMFAGRLPGGGAKLAAQLSDYRHLAMWVMAVRAEATGTVTRGLFGRPVVRYEPTARDMERFRDGFHLLARCHFAAGATQVITGLQGLPARLGPDEIDVIKQLPLDPRQFVGILSHLFGGCVMGADPDRSVCDPHGRVRGYDGLVVADASAFPGTLGVNPQHTIMALARVRAEELLEA